MSPVNNFIKKIKPFIQTLESESVEISKCVGRVIANDIFARCDIPNQNIAGVTGFAVRSDDISTVPVKLKKISKLPTDNPFTHQAIHLFSGDPIPGGFDIVIPEDKVQNENNYIIINNNYTSWQNVIIKGIDISNNDKIFEKGDLINVRGVAKAAAAKYSWLPVIRKPKVGVIISSKETIQDSNAKSQAIVSLIDTIGGIPINLGIAIDNSSPIEEVLSYKNEIKNAMEDMDLAIVIGDTLNTQNSLLWSSLAQFGSHLEEFPVNLGNKEVLIIGALKNTLIIGIPCSFVSMMLAGILYVVPSIFYMIKQDENLIEYKSKLAILSRNLDVIDKSSDYLYSYLEQNEKGELVVTPVSGQDFLMLSILSKADCIMVVDKTKPLKQGDIVEVILCSQSRLIT